MIKAIIFDFDETLSNRYANAYGVFDYYLRPFFKDLSDIEYEAVLQDMLTFDNNAAYGVETRVIPFLAKYKNLPEDFTVNFKKFYYEHMCDFVVLKNETIPTLEKLKGKYRLAILSNGDSKSQHDKIDATHLNGYFEEVVVSDDVGIRKPDKRIFEYVANKMNLKCEECIYVGDLFSGDILGAIRANMVPVWIRPYGRPSKYYQGYQIEKLDELIDILEKEK